MRVKSKSHLRCGDGFVTGQDEMEIRFSSRACEKALRYFYIAVICHEYAGFLTETVLMPSVKQILCVSSGSE
jgi:hypothetical protein